MTQAKIALMGLLAVVLTTACSVIDDDLSDCGSDYQLDYELRLVTNMTTELQTELSTQTDVNVASALRAHLSDIFTDYAHDVDLSFYDTQGDSARLQHDEHVMDANQASYTLYLPMRQYMHLAVANVVDNPIVELQDDSLCHTAQLRQMKRDTIDSHSTGIFTARLPMEVLSGVDQNFNVHLYMANCAASLVVDTVGSGIRSLRVFTTGFATGFNIADSAFAFAEKAPIVRTRALTTGSDGQLTFCSVNFPSPEDDAAGTRTIIETTDPFVSEDGTQGLWEFKVYAVIADGSTTETRLSVKAPLRAGQLRVVKAKVKSDGELTTNDQLVGVSVKLNWNQGGTYNPSL